MLIPPVKLFDRGGLSAGHRRHPVGQLPPADVALWRPQRPDQRAGTRREAHARAARRIWRRRPSREGLAELKARAAQMMRAQIAELPTGTVSAEDFLDNDGIVDEPLKIALDLTIEDGPHGDGLLALVAGLRRAGQHLPLDDDRRLLRGAEAHLRRRAGQCRACSSRSSSSSTRARSFRSRAPKPVGGYTETILRLIDVVFQAVAQIAPETGDGLRLRHDQRAVARRPPRRRAALGDVLLLRRRPWRAWRRRRPQPRQRADLDGDHPAAGNPRGGLSGALHAMGAAARFRRAGQLSRRARRHLRDRAAGEAGRRLPVRRARHGSPRRASSAAGAARANRFRYEQADGEHEPPMASKMVGIHITRGQQLRLETPGGGGYGDALRARPGARRARRAPRLRQPRKGAGA